MVQWKRNARRVYHELVRRRSRVRVVHAKSDTQLKVSPIFLVGMYRSGTTLLRYIIDSHSHICCPPESHFIGMLSPIVETRKGKHGLMSMGFEEDHVLQRLREFVIYFFSNYAASVGKTRWADKSPSYVDHLTFIERLFPEALFVMIHRHPLDQIHSHTDGGKNLRPHLEDYHGAGEDFRIASARYWKEKTEGMLDFERTHRNKCLRVFYEELATQPEEQLKPIFEFIGEPWEPEVLEFYRFEHVVGLEDGKVVGSRGFSISSGHYQTWTRELIEDCLKIVGPTMKQLGYVVEEP